MQKRILAWLLVLCMAFSILPITAFAATSPKVDHVEKLINAIGEVEYTKECKDKIDAAFNAYKELTAKQKEKVSNRDVLFAARKTYNKMLDDATKANTVAGMINNLPAVTEKDAEKQIEAARVAYDALSDWGKEYFDKNFPGLLDVLVKAEEDLFDYLHPVTIKQEIPTDAVVATPETFKFTIKNVGEKKFIGILNVDAFGVEDGMTLDFAPYTFKMRDDKSGYQVNVEVDAGKTIVVEAKADFVKSSTYLIQSWIKTDDINEVAGPDYLTVRAYDVAIDISGFAEDCLIRDPADQVDHEIVLTNTGSAEFKGDVQIRIDSEKFADEKLQLFQERVDAHGKKYTVEFTRAHDEDGKFIGYNIPVIIPADGAPHKIGKIIFKVEDDSYGTYPVEVSLNDYKLPATKPVTGEIVEFNYDLVLTQEIPEELEFDTLNEIKFNIENKGNQDYAGDIMIRFNGTNKDENLYFDYFNGSVGMVALYDAEGNLTGYDVNVYVSATMDLDITAGVYPYAFHEFKIQMLTEDRESAVSTVRVHNAAMERVVALVDAIDQPVTEYSEQQIIDAENAYHSELDYALLKDCFEDYYGVNYLKKLQKAKHDLVKAQDAAVENVETLINEIGYVTLEREDAINAAREAYDALPTGPVTNLKDRISNYKILLDAEQQLAFLKEVEKLVEEAEAAKNEAEQAAADAAAAQAAAEAAAKEAGESAEKAHDAQVAAEAAQTAAEEAQTKAEAAQAAAEAAQAAAEKAEGEAKKSAEAAAESAKQAAESAKQAAADAKTASDKAVEAAASAEAAHDAQVAAEAAQAAAEAAKADAEAAAQAAGEDKTQAEAAMNAAKAAQEAAEAAKEAAEAAQKAAEAANAEVAKAAAQVAADKAEVAKMKAEVAENLKKAQEAADNSLESAKISVNSAIDNELADLTEGQKKMAANLVKTAKEAVEAAKTNDEVKAIRDQFVKDIVYYRNYKVAYEYYTDVTKTDEWFYNGVEFMLNKGCMLGMTANEFAPHADLTRAQLVTILYRAAGTPSVEGKTNSFTDVAAGTWYTDAVVWAADAKVVNGVGDNKFAPEDKITREQLATMLYRYAGSPEEVKGDLSKFTDNADVDDYAEVALKWAVGEGVVNGCEGKLMPLANASRAHVAVMVARYFGGLEK